ncbi:MAG TPA: thioredoxin domain-containing protein [Saprospiraceae bacterium]|nr:thioredoxin domain-containing protein [Saprospiraceae bacterium]
MKHQYTNELIHETSPYLLQHAHNPVNWYAWNDASLAKAKAENKLLLISIGYSSCHWCHVMEHESFEDSTVADMMNKHFINIKVDREERPDIDDVYMTACQLSSGGNCGWPLNSFALPDGRPVWAGTYFPKKNWLEVLEYFRKTYEEEPEKLNDYAQNLVAGVQDHGLDTIIHGDEPALTNKNAEDVTKAFLSRMDARAGGRLGAPKFPMPNNWQYLMHYAKRYDHQESKAIVLTTLDKMMEGGIYDQLEGGFARYSTDDKWLVPHFEKMLYDNGQLVSLYAKAYAWTANEKYLEVVNQTLNFVDKYWSDPSGGFYSSFDADSEGEEGKYYVWTADELTQLITNAKDKDLFFAYYDIKPGGNWEQGKNILNRHRKPEDIARQQNITIEEFYKSISGSHEKLLSKRKSRVAPGLDDKILASWNGLMLEGYIDAYNATGENKYLDRALKNALFIKKELIKENFRLDRNYKNGKSTINAFLDDYAMVIQGFIALYQSTFDTTWLNDATGLTDHVLAHFDGDSSSLFYFTSDIDAPLIARRIDVSDNVIPSANSTMARNLFVLGELLYNTDYINRAQEMIQKVWPMILRDGQPSFYSNWCQLMLSMVKPPFEVAIVGDDYKNALSRMQRTYQPDAIFLGGKDDEGLPLLESKLSAGETLIYVCQNKICKIPTPDVEKALSMLEEK